MIFCRLKYGRLKGGKTKTSSPGVEPVKDYFQIDINMQSRPCHNLFFLHLKCKHESFTAMRARADFVKTILRSMKRQNDFPPFTPLSPLDQIKREGEGGECAAARKT